MLVNMIAKNLRDECIHFISYRYDVVAATSDFKALPQVTKNLLMSHKKIGNFLIEEENPEKKRNMFLKLFT